jgi:transposase InsO family protein
MDRDPFLVSVRVNGIAYASTLLDLGCLSYGTVSQRFARQNCLPRIKIPPRTLESIDSKTYHAISEVTYVSIDLEGHAQQRIFLYVIPNQLSYDIILGKPWMEDEDVVISPRKARIHIRSSGTRVWSENFRDRLIPNINCSQINASTFVAYAQRSRREKSIQMFKISLQDIEKALSQKKTNDFYSKLPTQYQEFLSLFDPKVANQLPPHREGIDHEIRLQQGPDGKEIEPSYGPLYNMSREELLVLRRTLTELLDKNFIRVSQSPAASPVLFVRKPGGGLRFCVDYRALNRITCKDRYPLPLFTETLRAICKARWFTKLDVTAAFHRIRVLKGDEWKTAFRTRYGLYEWQVMPFGLTGAPGTFQRYVNWILRQYLDEFVSAYIDDILIFTDGSLEDHRAKVKLVLARLQEAGLQLDIDKCEFEVQTVKYLGFIITAGKGIQMDPAKVEAIASWEAPTSVKAIRSFLGFANFYRRFIKGFSDLARPLTQLTKKGVPFAWTEETETAFNDLKTRFITAPVLGQFDPEAETVLEADSSGWAIGGSLSQYDASQNLRPIAFFSQKNTPAECNYGIGDKELLAIIKCLDEWDAELRSVRTFTILTDHENLQRFMTKQKLTERQIRWAEKLSRYNFKIVFRPGSQAIVPDALSRREQDKPQDPSDERVQAREVQLFDPHTGLLSQDVRNGVTLMASSTQDATATANLDDEWATAAMHDQQYQLALQAVQEGQQTFPKKAELKLSIAECDVLDGRLRYRERLWVPASETLRTNLMQQIHDSGLSGHPGRHAMLDLLSRQFFWPNISQDIRRFVRNCETCGRTKSWREQKRGLLKPLPIPNRIWREISIDFIVDLPPSRRSQAINCMVITDRLSKGKIYEPMTDISAEAVADRLLWCFVRHHGIPAGIVSDRGPQFVGHLWKRLCSQLRITRRLSTAYHPETDGATERANQELECYLRIFASYAQDDWEELLPIAELASNNKSSSSTGISPFFMTHGYHVDLLDTPTTPYPETPSKTPIEQAEDIVAKLKHAQDWAQAALTLAQQQQEKHANKHRQPSPQFKVGDRVWLSLKNLRTLRPSKKLDWKQAPFTVTEVIGSHACRLDTPPGIHNVFHVCLLRPAATDPWPNQKNEPKEPPPIISDKGEEEYEVEEIVQCRTTQKNGKPIRQALVKWRGYTKPTWEPLEEFLDTSALDHFEAAYGPSNANDGPKPRRRRTKGEKGGNCKGLEALEPSGRLRPRTTSSATNRSPAEARRCNKPITSLRRASVGHDR